MLQEKLIQLLISLVVFVASVGGASWYFYGKGYSAATATLEAKYTKTALDTVLKTDDTINKNNTAVAVIAKDLETKKIAQSTLKDKNDEKIKTEIISVPVYSECIVPPGSVRINADTTDKLNEIRHSGKPVSPVSRP